MPALGVVGPSVRPQAIFPMLLVGLTCSVSTALTVNFCFELRGERGVVASMLAVALGLAWEMAKYVFAPLGLHRIASERPGETLTGIVLCALSSVLVAGSVAASLGYLLTVDDHRQAAAVHTSHRFIDLQSQLGALDEQITVLSHTAAADSAAGYRERALRTIADARELQLQRTQLGEQLASMDASPASVVESPFFATLGALFPGDSETNASRVRLAAHTSVAVMLEVISIAAIWLLQKMRRDATDAQSHLRDPVGTCAELDARGAVQPARRPTLVVAPARGDTGVSSDCGVDHRYRHAKELVTAAHVAPSYRALQQSLQLGQGTAKRFLAAMVAEGVLHRDGKRYVVAQAA